MIKYINAMSMNDDKKVLNKTLKLNLHHLFEQQQIPIKPQEFY